MSVAVPLNIRDMRGDKMPHAKDPATKAGLLVHDDLAPPEFLAPYAREEWIRLVPMLVRMRLLSRVDVNMLAQYCQSFARWKAAEEAINRLAAEDAESENGLMARQGISKRSKNRRANPMIVLAHNAAWEMCKYGGELGLTPAARARIAGGAKGGPSKFDGLMAGADN